MRFLIPLTCFLCALAFPSYAQLRATKKGYLFRARFVKGETYRYQVLSNVLVPSMRSPITVKGPFTIDVLGTRGEDGLLEADFGPLKNGTHELMERQKFNYREDKLGQIVGAKLPQMSVVFPSAPKKPGETWSAKTSVQSIGSNSVVTAAYRFAGITSLHGKKVAKLNVMLSSKGETDTKGSGDIYVLVSDGSLYSSRFHITVTSGQGLISSSMTLERI